jgi:hypothetical protein
METKHRKGDFLLLESHSYHQSSETSPVRDQMVVALTGTIEKFTSLLELVQVNGEFVSGVLGCELFSDAGKAPEPVTTDCVTLMVGKQRGQRQLLLESLARDREMKQRYLGHDLLLSSNDINTDMDTIPLTKSPLQKETTLVQGEYEDLITASLKYLAMQNTGVKMDYTWKKMQSSWELIDICLRTPWKGRAFLPIDYQTIDAFDLETLTLGQNGSPFLEKKGPTIAVINRAYVNLELDFRLGNDLVKGIIGEYLADNWEQSDFKPSRYPLGIRQKDLLGKFAEKGQHVLFSDHELRDSVSLKEWYQEDVTKIDEPLDRVEHMLNGFNASSVRIAREMYSKMKSYDKKYLFVVTRKPGRNDRVERSLLPKGNH